MSDKKQDNSFEKNIDRLEELMNSMKDANIDDMMVMYAEAVKLLNECKQKLDGYKAEFKQISLDGELTDIDTEK